MKISPEQYREVGQRVRQWRRPLLLTHARADGDAIGCLTAARRLLRGLGASPRAFTFEPVSPRYHLLVEGDPLDRWDATSATELQDIDGILIMDTCTYNQIEPAADWIRQSRAPKVALDHHLTRDALADDFLIDESASAACLILSEWARAAGWSIDSLTAEALFVGIATDTGWFRYSNTDARTLRTADKLVDAGVKPHELHQRIYQTDSVARFRLWAIGLHTLELHTMPSGGLLAVMMLPQSAFQSTEAIMADTEDLVSEPLRMNDVVASILLVEQSDGIIRVGLRSKPAVIGSPRPDIDVAKIAATLGGGGHSRAAGVRIQGNIETVRAAVIRKLIAHD